MYLRTIRLHMCYTRQWRLEGFNPVTLRRPLRRPRVRRLHEQGILLRQHVLILTKNTSERIRQGDVQLQTLKYKENTDEH